MKQPTREMLERELILMHKQNVLLGAALVRATAELVELRQAHIGRIKFGELRWRGQALICVDARVQNELSAALDALLSD